MSGLYKYTDLRAYRASVQAEREQFDKMSELALLSREDLLIKDAELSEKEKRVELVSEASAGFGRKLNLVLEGDYADNVAAWVEPNKNEDVNLVLDHVGSVAETRATLRHEELHFEAGIYALPLQEYLDAEQRAFFARELGMSANDYDGVEGLVEMRTWELEPAGESRSGYKEYVRVTKALESKIWASEGESLKAEFFDKTNDADDVMELIGAWIDRALGRVDEEQKAA